ncbi:MAG: hypothetical protein ACLSAF_17195 [Intestinimonas sp.]
MEETYLADYGLGFEEVLARTPLILPPSVSSARRRERTPWGI